MDGQRDRCMEGCMHGWIDGWVYGRMDGEWMGRGTVDELVVDNGWVRDGWMDGCMSVWAGGCMGTWMERWMLE